MKERISLNKVTNGSENLFKSLLKITAFQNREIFRLSDVLPDDPNNERLGLSFFPNGEKIVSTKSVPRVDRML